MGSSTDFDDVISEIREDIAGIHRTLVNHGEMLAGHEVRFGNGREVMTDIKRDIADLEKETSAEIDKLKPKAPDWLKLLGAGGGLLIVTLGAHYWLIEQLNDRPTAVQIEKAFHEHAGAGHATTQRDINTIRDTQTEQRVLLNGLKDTVSEQGAKLDTILERLPDRGDR